MLIRCRFTKNLSRGFTCCGARIMTSLLRPFTFDRYKVNQPFVATLDTSDKQDKPDKPGKSDKPALTLSWKKEFIQGTMATQPGVYCLRTNVLDWDEQKLWQNYSTLTDIESVFRSLKGEPGLRPVFHQKENRSDGHLFMTVLAYQCVQVIRKTRKEQGIHDSWATLRNTLSVQ